MYDADGSSKSIRYIGLDFFKEHLERARFPYKVHKMDYVSYDYNFFYGFCINAEHTRILQAKMGLKQGDFLFPMLFVIVMKYT